MGQLYQALVQELKKKLDGDISVGELDREVHSRDWSLFKVMPEVIVYPKHSKDIQTLVKTVNKFRDERGGKKLSITARAAGTGMSGGSLNDSIIVDVTRHMNHGIEIIPGDFGAQGLPGKNMYKISGMGTAQPGVMYREFEEAAAVYDLQMPCYPASKKICAVGGMVANNGAGEKTLKYGQNKDFVAKLKVVLSDGKEYSVEPISFKKLSSIAKKRNAQGNLYRQVWKLLEKDFDFIKSKQPKTSKNAAGYLIWDVLQAESIAAFRKGKGIFDPTKLFVGAQGTTGIITEITYKLVNIEKATDLVVVFIKDLDKIPQVVQTLLKHDLDSLEVYDDNTFKFAMKFAWDIVKSKGFFGAARFGMSFLPEVFLALTKGVPKMVVLAEFADSSGAVSRQEAEAAYANIQDLMEEGDKIFKTRLNEQGTKTLRSKREAMHERHHGLASRIVGTRAGKEKFWDMRRESFKLLTDHSKGMRTAPFIDDFVIAPEHLPEFLPKLNTLLGKYNLLYTIAGHIGNGNLHIIPLIEIGDSKIIDVVLSLSPKVYDLVLSYGGSITAEHNDGIIRTPYLKQMFGPKMIGIFKKVKEAADPDTIFNPGKKVGGTFKDISKYLDNGSLDHEIIH